MEPRAHKGQTKCKKRPQAPSKGYGPIRKRKAFSVENEALHVPKGKGTQAPTYWCTESPSASPSISQKPSVSLEPTITSSPTTQPSLAFSPWCQDIENGDLTNVPQTSNVVTGNYIYEMVYKNSANLVDVLEALDKSVLEDLIADHVWCGETRNRRSLALASVKPGHVLGIKTTSVKRSERRLVMDGVSLDGTDTANSNTCAALKSGPGATCGVFDGSFTIYLRDNSDLSHQEAKDNVLRTIRDGMDTAKGGTLVSRNEDIDKLYYHGDTFTGAGLGVPALAEKLSNPVYTTLSGMGIFVVAAGSIVTLMFIFAATRRRERYKLRRDVQVIEEDAFLFGDGKGIGLDDVDRDTDIMSADRNALILGDDDSQYSGENIYGYGDRRSRNLTESDAVNVHKCTSATCEICSRNRQIDPMFVKSMYPDVSIMSQAKKRDYSTPDTIAI